MRLVFGFVTVLALAAASACTSSPIQSGASGSATPVGGALSSPAPAIAAAPVPPPRPAVPPAAAGVAVPTPAARPAVAAAPASAAAAGAASVAAVPAKAAGPDPQNTLYMDVSYGRVVVKLRPDLAPNHVERVKALVRKGFYDKTPFHRVMAGFMAQGGDPTGTGTGGSDLPNLKAEFSKTHFVRGTVGAARSGDPDSANSQFFIMFAPAPNLDGQYTVWGEVVSGMEFVDKIKKGDSAQNGVVDQPDRIVKLQLAADVK